MNFYKNKYISQNIRNNQFNNKPLSLKNRKQYKFVIQTTPYLLNIGNAIKKTLQILNLEAECINSNDIINSIKKKKSLKTLFLYFCLLVMYAYYLITYFIFTT